MSTSSVLISTSRNVRVGACQATISTIPRSPPRLNETSGRTPAGRDEHLRDGFRHRTVTARQRSLECAAAPSRLDEEVDLEDSRHPPEAPYRDSIKMTTFHVGIQRVGNAGAIGDVLLSPVEPLPDAPKDTTERQVIHRSILRAGAYPRITPTPCETGVGQPASPRSTNRPKPRVPTKEPSRMTGRPRTKTERTAPERRKPSYGV